MNPAIFFSKWGPGRITSSVIARALFRALVLSLNLFVLRPTWASADISPSSRDLQANERRFVFKSIASAIEHKYTFLQFKTQMLDFDFHEWRRECEDQIENTRNDFYETLQICLAQFQDFHLYAREQVEKPILTLGIELAEVDGNFFVSAYIPSLFALARSTAQLPLPESPLGLQVESVDGLPVNQWVARQESFFPSGSKLARRRLAIRNLTIRSMDWPIRNLAYLKFKHHHAVFSMQWWSLGFNSREDTRARLRSLGIENLRRQIPGVLKLEDLDSHWLGYRSKASIATKIISTYKDESGRTFLRTGTISASTQEFCYIQLQSLAVKQWRSDRGESVRSENPIITHATDCADKGLSVILDLRWNNGGDPLLVRRLLRQVISENQQLPGYWTSGRITSHLRQVLERLSLGDSFESINGGSFGPILEGLDLALARGEEYLPWIYSGTSSGSRKAQAKEINWLLMVGPECSSSCELLVELMSPLRNVRIVGEPLQGSSGGYIEMGENELPRASWRDDIFGTVTVHIPNSITLVGLGEESSEPMQPFASKLGALRENRPFSGLNLHYSPKAKDWLNLGSGWVEALTVVSK